MDKRVEDRVDFPDDFSPMEEESMPEAALHDKLIQYLVEVLEWLFHRQWCAIHRNLAFYYIRDRSILTIAPDLAVIKGLPFQPIKSWRVGKTGPAPHVVFEALSEETWRKDLEEKPDVYADMGVQEYFAYDPNLIPLAPETTQRLFGWRLDPALDRMVPLTANEDTSLWSHELNSFLVPDQEILRLYDPDYHLRLTGEEAEAAARQAAEEKVRVLLEKLRSQGIDPDKL
jgi:Uma2 family endonuclease